MNSNRQAYQSLLLAAIVGITSALRAEEPRLTVKQDDRGAQVLINGRLYCGYQTNSISRPVVWPIYGPGGHAMTRSWPVGQRGENEETDHSHHRSLWFAYEGINGVDFWHDPNANGHLPVGKVVHDKFLDVESEGKVAIIATSNKYQHPDGTVVARDERVLRFGLDGAARWIDFHLKLWSPNGPLVLGDTKEGAFAMRVPGMMKVDAGMGGKIVSSTGHTNADTWGKPASWVDYSGPVTGDASGNEIVGIAIFSHPSNKPANPCWHVRPYGLFAANPFGRKPYGQPGPGGIRKQQDEPVRLRFRVYLHPGDVKQGRVAEAFERYTASS